MPLNVQWVGIETVRANLKTLSERYPQEMGTVLREEGVAIIDTANPIVPFDQENEHEDGSPHLNETGQVEGPYFENDIATVILSYGQGINSIYPIVQHEVQEFHHDFPEQWKFLEHPLNERAKYIPANLIKGVDLERMLREGQGGGYVAPKMTAIKTGEAERAISNARQKAINKYSQLAGRYQI